MRREWKVWRDLATIDVVAVWMAATVHFRGAETGALLGVAAGGVDLGLRAATIAANRSRSRQSKRPAVTERAFQWALGTVGLSTCAGAGVAAHVRAENPLVAAMATLAVFSTLSNGVNRVLVRRWCRANVASSARLPLPAAALAELRLNGDNRLEVLLAEADAHEREGNVGYSFALWREALDREDLAQEWRGHLAGRLAWALLGRYPDDPVPTESRQLFEEARRHAPRAQQTAMIEAFLAAWDGDAQLALDTAALVRAGTDHDTLSSQMLCIEAVSQHQLGYGDLATASREKAARLWPECDLLSWADERLATLPSSVAGHSGEDYSAITGHIADEGSAGSF